MPLSDADKVVKLRAALEACREQHNYCEDSWYSCPMHPEGCADDRQPATKCTCGAEVHNAAIDKVLLETV